MKLTRVAHEPILLPTENAWENEGVFNPAVVGWQGKVRLIYRGQGKDGISRLGMATMNKMTYVEERSSRPIFEPDLSNEYETMGVEDPRISQVGKEYFMIYVAASKYQTLDKTPLYPRDDDWRVRVSLAITNDFVSWSRIGVIISHVDSKDACLFPKRIDGNFCLLHRVIPHIRIAISEESRRGYQESGPVFGPRAGMWDGNRVGIGAPPMKTPYGWILFYHGVDERKIYRLGLALLDLKNPSLVLGRTNEPILEPELSWEKEGRVNNVVFTCGAILTDEKYWIYYGAADTVIGLAAIDKDEVWNWAKSLLQ